MRAASAVADITPHGLFWMEGYIHPCRKKPALGVHDTPYATLLLLEQGGEELLFVSIDVCIVSDEATRPLREGLASCVGIEQSHIVISSIHSHSCANGFEEPQSAMGIPTTPGYVSMVTGRIIEEATRLRPALVEVAAEVLITSVRGWYSNRNDAERPFDDEAFVLRFRTEEGKVAGAMLNFNCHATVVGPTNRLLTTDVIGSVRAELTDWIGIVPYVFTGASGDLGNRQFRQGNDFAELRRVSNGIAGVIMQGSFEPVELDAPQIRAFDYHVSYNNEDFYPEYRHQLAKVCEVLADSPTPDEMKLADTEREMLERQLKRHEVSFDIHVVTIDMGPLVFVTFPGELASDLGAYIKASFEGSKHVVIIGYANDYQGYFVPEGDFGGTSYESYVTPMPKGWTECMLETYRAQLST